MTEFLEKFDGYTRQFERDLEKYCAEMNYRPAVLAESMRYSLQGGGKRLRPALFFSALESFGGNAGEEGMLALAIECIHTYSLIHDDLPEMDNDDFRRGMPSNHKKFGEANAILAGDALLSEACSIALSESGRGETHRLAAKWLIDAAGAGGMIAGQSADILYENSDDSGEDALQFIYANKTGKLIAAPLVMAAILTGRNFTEMCAFGAELGVLFQMTDDILDVKGKSEDLGKTVGKDSAENKLTCVKLYGLKSAELRADLVAERCEAQLEGIAEDVSFLRQLVRFVRTRTH